MDPATEISKFQIDEAIDAERRQMMALAERAIARSPHTGNELAAALADMQRRIAAASHPVESERALEAFARGLRRIWIRSAASATSKVYRSPTDDQTPRNTAGSPVEFEYERDLHPDALERRCEAFFGPTPRAWNVEHTVFSSGQSAMAAALLSAKTILYSQQQPVKIAHLGAYFETRELIDLMPFQYGVQDGKFTGESDIYVVEPISCDGEFSLVDVASLVSLLNTCPWKPRVVVLDTTLLGRSDNLSAWLAALEALRPEAVMRVVSGLKLFQSGLELADVGILSIFQPWQRSTSNICHTVKKIRTLFGTGLRFAEVAALEAPWFLDADLTNAHTAAIYRNNSKLAAALHRCRRVAPVSHPALCDPALSAPYCVFRFRSDDPDVYEKLEEDLTRGAAARRLLFERGGSFGFRGHRFEVVRPQNSQPFLRVAMGCRSGWSCEGIIQFLRHYADGPL